MVSSPPLVLIHGTNAGPWTLQNFTDFFTEHGFDCHTPAYRHHPVTTAKTTESDKLTDVSIADYVEDVEKVVRELDKKPILIGHSLGGVVAQILAAKGLAAGVILLNGSVVNGTLPTTDEERNLFKAFISAGPFWEGTLLPDFEVMSKYGLNMLENERDRRAIFDRLGPESGRVLFELFFWMYDINETTKIDFEAVECPLLFISGTEDLAIPPSTSRTIAAKYGDKATFYEAQGFGHYLMAEKHWRRIADICLHWIWQKQLGDVLNVIVD